MSYERYKTGTFRVCVFLTVLIEALAFLGKSGGSTDLLGITGSIYMEEAVFGTPVFIWSIYFFSLWIAKGFMGEN